MPQNQPRHSDMWWHGHNDALAGDPPNESYYHYYYDYKLAYDQVRRDQRRNQRQQLVNRTAQRMLLIGPIVLLLGLLAYAAWTQYQPDPLVAGQVQVVPTATPRPTPRPTLPAPTPTPEPSLHIDGLAIITGTEGAALRARARPGTGSDVPIQTRFREGQTVRILEGPQSADDLEWWRVEADGESGWAAAPYLKPAEPTTTP